MSDQKFSLGEMVNDKANKCIPMVIRKIKKSFFSRPQKYEVGYYDGGTFHTAIALEHELEKIIK